MARWIYQKPCIYILGDGTEQIEPGETADDVAPDSLTWQEAQSLKKTRERAPLHANVRAVQARGRLRIVTVGDEVVLPEVWEDLKRAAARVKAGGKR